MSDDPFRSAQLPASEARRILRRAIDLAERDPTMLGDEPSVSRADLERKGAELGLAPAALTRAMAPGADDDVDRADDRSPSPGWFIGAPTRVVLERDLPGEPSVTDREDLVEALRAEFYEPGTIEQLGKTFTWKRLTDARGQSPNFSVRLRWRDGRTKVVVEENLKRQAIGLFVGIGVGAGVGPLGGYIALITHVGAIGLLGPALWIPCMLLLARTIFGALSARREETARRVMRRVVEGAAHWKAPRVRVAADASADDGAAAEDEQAEDEAAEAEAARANR